MLRKFKGHQPQQNNFLQIFSHSKNSKTVHALCCWHCNIFANHSKDHDYQLVLEAYRQMWYNLMPNKH